MNVRTLIDAIVRQTVVLIAQLATSGGLRAPLSHMAEQVFLELAQELQRQGVSRKVSADMFGMALRTYQRRTQRIAQSQTDRGRSLWEAVYDHVRAGDVVTRQEVLHRFRHDDEGSVRGVLRDLIDSGLLFASGTGRATVYRLSTTEEQAKVSRGTERGDLEPLLWSVVFREGPMTLAELCQACRLAEAEVSPGLEALVQQGRVEAEAPAGEPTRYRSATLVLPLDDPAGWEASVLDHYSAVVRTIAGKLRTDQQSRRRDSTGGSTYHFALYRGHPLESEVLGELERFRARQSELRRRVDEHNRTHGLGPQELSVTAYYGQVVEGNGCDDET